MQVENYSERGTGADERGGKGRELEAKLRERRATNGVNKARKEVLYFTNKNFKCPRNETFSRGCFVSPDAKMFQQQCEFLYNQNSQFDKEYP